jgi:GMP synthase-like glutamine amidotransferase
MTTCLVIQHVEPEGPWAIADALTRAGVSVDLRRTHVGDPLPSALGTCAGLVVMGGPMSATSDAGFATRAGELTLLGEAVRRGVPTLGVCLGAQLLAAAAGGRVHGGDGLEVGWGPVLLTAEARRDDPLLSGLPGALIVLHWHGETFELPPGASHLARNDRYANQAFRAGRCAWGLQFHLEVTPDAVEGMVVAFPADAARSPGGSTALAGRTAGALTALATHRDLVFDRFAALVAAGVGAAEADGSRHGFADVSNP